MTRFWTAAAFLLPVAGCSAPPSPAGNKAAPAKTGPENGQANVVAPSPAGPAAPGTPGGLSDDRRPVAEAPFAETGAQGAADVVQHYYALIEAGLYADAWRLWGDGGKASGSTEADFAAGLGKVRDTHAEIGAPGRIEGAAGSLYVDVPVQLYGRDGDGAAFRRRATVTLRRVNDVPGATAEQRRWHISAVAEDSGPEK